MTVIIARALSHCRPAELERAGGIALMRAKGSYITPPLQATTLTGLEASLQNPGRLKDLAWNVDDEYSPMIKDILRQATRLLLPMDCTTCAQPLTDDPVPFFCRRCWELIRPLRGPSCPRCHRPFASPSAITHSPTHECQDCRTREPHYSQVWAPYAYCSPLQDAIALFKYRGKVALADALGALLTKALPDRLDLDVLMPIPLHPNRLRKREFNQSLLLADRIGPALGLPISYRNLIRTVETDPQISLPRAARLQNLRKAFAVRAPQEVAGARILLVDDVFTTGTTASECARVLLQAGANQVAVLALARSVDAGMVPDTWLPASIINQGQIQRA